MFAQTALYREQLEQKTKELKEFQQPYENNVLICLAEDFQIIQGIDLSFSDEELGKAVRLSLNRHITEPLLLIPAKCK